MDIGTRVRITEAVLRNNEANLDETGESLDYTALVGAEATVTEDPIAWLRSFLGVDQVLPHTVKLDEPEKDPAYERILEAAPDQVGIIYLAEDEVETINTEDTVNA